MSFIHREGYSTLRAVGAALALVCAAAWLWLPRSASRLVIALAALVFGFFAQFFRNPQRHIPNSANAVLSPADGTIVAIEPVHEGEYFQTERLKVSIYMSAFNVHLNRVPVSGRVAYTRYHPGQYLVAFHPKASELNERNSIVIERADGQAVLVRQIAGLLARRIRCYVAEGQTLQAGDELGFIKFGSRCDVFLPLDARVQVQLEQKVKGGETILAEMSS
ncbi:MAG: phosphatidylserine decarboxylase family protein [Anaerolineae bacterium]|nr:phosphatidylserine decarboxylase family protein [Anaerolineae bacterium]